MVNKKWLCITYDGANGDVWAKTCRYKRSRFPWLSNEDGVVVAIDSANGCIRYYDLPTVDGLRIMRDKPFFELYPAGVSRDALLDAFYWDEARSIYFAYTGREAFDEDATTGGRRKRKAVQPVERWLQVTRSDGCLVMVKDFPVITAGGQYRAVGVWSNGVSVYKACLGVCIPPKDSDRIIHLGPAAIDAGGLVKYLEPRDVTEVGVVFVMNRRWLFNAIIGGKRPAEAHGIHG